MSIMRSTSKEQPFSFANLFKGRLNRLQYFLLTLMQVMCIIVTTVVFLSVIPDDIGDNVDMGLGATMLALLYVAVMITYIIVMFSLNIRRGHDFGASGWLSLLGLIPYVGLVYHLVLLFVPGTDGRNAYGRKPDSDTGLIKAFKGID